MRESGWGIEGWVEVGRGWLEGARKKEEEWGLGLGGWR